jgi:hypothetical protein
MSGIKEGLGFFDQNNEKILIDNKRWFLKHEESKWLPANQRVNVWPIAERFLLVCRALSQNLSK